MTAETDFQTSWSKVVKLVRDCEAFALGGYLTDEATAYAGATADATPELQDMVQSVHASVFGLYGLYAPIFFAGIRPLARVMTYAETDPAAIWLRYFEHAGVAPVTVKSRNRTFNAPSAGTNVGTGSLIRLTVDRYGYNIENGADEAKSCTCVADQNSGGTRHQETFLFRGAAISKTIWPYQGQGGQQTYAVLGINSYRYVSNPGFETWDTTLGPVGWTVAGSVSNLASYSASTYKDVLPSTITPLALQFTASEVIYQPWNLNAINWNPYVPMYAQLAWKRLASATGTLKLKIGGIEVTVDVSTGTNGVWNVLRWPVNSTTPNKNAWFLNWNITTDAATPPSHPFIRIEMASLAVGTVVIDEVTVGPYNGFDGSWWQLIGGPVPFQRDDVYTMSDSSAATAINQTFLARGFGVYLPAVTDGSQTWAEPS